MVGEEQFRIYKALSVYSNHFIEWTPDGKQLMLNAPKEGETIGTGIYLVSADGSSARLLVDASSEYNMLAGIHADLSPDGSTLVYSTCRRRGINSEYREYQIATLNVEDGSPGRAINYAIVFESYPVWSPNGSLIAYLSSRPPHLGRSATRVYTREADGLGRRDLAPHLNWGYFALPVPPTWSPDGERLGYVQIADQFSRLYTVAKDGSGLHGVTAVTTGASWAPEGLRIAFGKSLPRGSPDDPRSTLCLAELDDRGRPRLSQITPTDAFPGRAEIKHVNWSPNGDEILFIVGEGGQEYNEEFRKFVNPDVPRVTSVYLVRPDGTELRRLLEDERPYTAAAWSPDGSQIAVRVDPQLGYIYRDGPRFPDLEQVSPLFEVLIVDRDGAVQTEAGKG